MLQALERLGGGLDAGWTRTAPFENARDQRTAIGFVIGDEYGDAIQSRKFNSLQGIR